MRVAPCDFAVDGCCGGNYTGIGVDRKQAIWVAGQTVGDRVVGGVQIEGIRRDPDRGADDRVFSDFVGRAVCICRDADIKLIQIVDRDVERL